MPHCDGCRVAGQFRSLFSSDSRIMTVVWSRAAGSSFSLFASAAPGRDRPERAHCLRKRAPAGLPPLEEVERPQAMASPSYGIDVVALALAVVLAAAVLFLLAQIVPQLTDLMMMMPPPLSGTR